MALQDCPNPSSSTIDIDIDINISSAHRSLFSATEAALNFAASFHRDAQACRGTRERQQLHEIYRDKILAIDGIAANVAAAFLPFFRTFRSPRNGNHESWSDFDRLAQRGKKMRDRESQHLQHQSGVIAAWGLERFEHYDWHALPVPLLRQLRDLAVLMPHWEDVVDLLNSKMLARHELRVVHGKNKALRVGEHSPASKVQAPHSPVERSDILAALEWAQTKATSVAARREIAQSARCINGTPIRQFGLKLDVFGMVVPSTDNETEDGDDDHADDDASDGDHHRRFARPTKRTRLSFTSHGSSIFPSITASHETHKNRTRGRGHSVIRDSSSPGTESPKPEEYKESEESGVESEDHIARDDTSGNENSEPEEKRVEEGGGGDNTSKSDLPGLYAIMETRKSPITSSEVRDIEGIGLEVTSSRSEKEKRVSSIEDEEMVSEAVGRMPNTAILYLSEQGIAQEAEVGVEESIFRSLSIEIGVEKEATRSPSQDEHSHDTGDDDKTEAQFTETSLKEPVVGPYKLYGQNQRAKQSTPQGSMLQTTSHPVADRTFVTSYQVTAAVIGPGNSQSLPVTNSGESIGRAPTAEDAPSLYKSGPELQMRSSPVSLEDGPPPQQPTLLQSLQARHTDTVRRLVDDLGRPHISQDVVHQRRLQLNWLDPQRWARIYAEPEHRLGTSCVKSPEDADVWYLSWEVFRIYAESGHIFRRPVVIKQEFQDSGTYDIVDYVDMLWQRFPEQQVDVQNSMTGACSSMSLAEYCLAVADVGLSSSDAAAAISSVTNLRRLARADEPLLSRLPRFRLLSTLADRVAGTVGRSGHLVMNDVQGCLGFNLLAFAGAFSGSYVDPLIGSWVRCLSGLQIVAVATNLDAEDWRQFSEEGRGWSPRDKGRFIILEQDDVLLMPPGLRAVRATFAPEPCLMEGGMLWDECSIPETLEGLLWVVNNRKYTDGSIRFALQLFPFIDALEKWLDDENYVGQTSAQATVTERYQTVKVGIRSLRALLQLSL
ncbi:hypothetical protein CI238_05289 [Colletotrichum incanum]|uniref:Uncharacterized protein n=1 Tax=Colletotrichum incanum TaxID=1573173 RepID=A0A162NCE2_COLIC|nr:hypothetical protein CI238_05289 [Colletotrichum incanum]OHX00953.1 hypothetical protein CSPAE12_00307 [Colletotrichum incanum]